MTHEVCEAHPRGVDLVASILGDWMVMTTLPVDVKGGGL